jgi:hypothetical protein
VSLAILATRINSFCRPRAQGLEREFKETGVANPLLNEGLESLSRKPMRTSGNGANWTGRRLRLAQGCAAWLNVQRLLNQLQTVDAVVIVGSMSRAYDERLIDIARTTI